MNVKNKLDVIYHSWEAGETPVRAEAADVSWRMLVEYLGQGYEIKSTAVTGNIVRWVLVKELE